MKTLLEELQTLNTLTGEEHDCKCKEIAAKWNSSDDRQAISEWLEHSIANIDSDLENVARKLDEISH